MGSRRFSQAILVAVIALVVPASASASYTITDGQTGNLVVSGDDGKNHLTVYYGSRTGTPGFELSGENKETITESSTHCAHHPTFEIVTCDYQISKFVTKLGAGNDSTFFLQDTSGQPWPAAVALLLFGGADNDALRAADGDDTIRGGSGVDRLLGYAGSDTLFAKDGEVDRQISCGAGQDPEARRDDTDPIPRSC